MAKKENGAVVVNAEWLDITMTMFAALDPFRHPQHPDDVQAHLEQDGFDREVVRVRLTDVYESELPGILLNEPNQNFWCHVQDLLKMAYDEINSRLSAIL